MTWTNGKRPSRSVAMLTAVSVMGLGAVLATTAPAGASIAATNGLADFEAGPPAEFFAFNGGSSSVQTNAVTIADSDPRARPGQSGDVGALEVVFGVADFGGFGGAYEQAGAQDWSNFTSFDFWFLGTGSGLAYQAEIADNRSNPASDTSERFDYTFTDDAAGWTYVSIPFSDFTRATDFQPGGAPDDGFTLTEVWSWAFVLPQGADTVVIDDVALGLPLVDDFQGDLPFFDTTPPTGYFTFSGAGSGMGISTETAPPAPELPVRDGSGNSVLRMDVESTSFAGYINAFADDAGTWQSENWAAYQGIQFWFHGEGSGSQLFIDLLENRSVGSTTDDAERWSVAFTDDVAGWRKLELPFSSFTRKEIGNGAPNDGLTLDTVWGYAFGALGTGGPRTFYLDDVALYGVGEVPPVRVSLAVQNSSIEEGTTGQVRVRLNRPLAEGDPDEVSVAYATETEASIAVEGREYTPTSGTLTFVQGGASELSFPVETFDDTKWEGNERVVVRLSDVVGAEPGAILQGSVFLVDDDPFDPNLVDDFERGAYLWSADSGLGVAATEVGAGDAGARPGQDAFENVLEVTTPVAATISLDDKWCRTKADTSDGKKPKAPKPPKLPANVTVALLSSTAFDATDVDHTTVRFGGASELHTRGRAKTPTRHVDDVNHDGLDDLVFHFRTRDTGYDCSTEFLTLTGMTTSGTPVVANGEPASFGRDFAIGQDWTRGEALSFWYEGTGSGEQVTAYLKENRAADPGPAAWDMVWSDEFDEAVGTPPNPENWNFEIGDVTPDGKNGWGNEELQYYTDDPANASTDGDGNLAITLRDAEDGQQCYYGECEYTSARLTSWNKAEFAYGRIESRIKVPSGQGIWPAFWSLGTDIDVVSWPQTGEIDFMEFVGRLPNEIFGTIHGPGYAGGNSYSGIYDDFGGETVPESYHTYAVEWEPDVVRWYIDGIQYHEASPEDVAPNEWVFNDPVFLLLNVAVGGNFGGSVGESLQPPSSMLVDYVRVYQGPDTAERWETSFTDSVAGWQQVTVPFADLTRSAQQPAGAPDDGLTLDEVWGYGFELPGGGTASGRARLDLVQLDLAPKPDQVTVTSADSSGPGSLRAALGEVATGGTVVVDPALAGATVNLRAPLQPAYDVTIDATAAPGFTLDGGGVNRVLVVPVGTDVTARGVTITNGYGFQLGGGVLNNGTLTLDRSTVTGNVMTTDAGDFWQGGGGVYNGDGATFTLIDSTVSDNSSGWTGGGVYSFFNTTTTIVRSTISGNSAADVGGGLRTLGAADVQNSTLSGNSAGAFQGSAWFVTDGVTTMSSSTVTGNTGPADVAAVFVGTFGDSAASLELRNSVVSGNSGNGCFLAPFGPGPVSITSLGGNVLGDSSCNPGAADQVVADAGLGALADNGGPTRTHALLPGSPAVGAADTASSPTTDQRGVARDAAPDAGAYELQ